MLTVEYAARSHIGKVRENNEDNLFIDGVMLPENGAKSFRIDGIADVPTILAVCDGMGGETDGEIASCLASQTLFDYKEQLKAASPRHLEQMVQEYVRAASANIRRETGGQRTGTTLALAIIAKSGTYGFNLGDSRIYYLKRGIFRQLTNDHTWGAEQKRLYPEKQISNDRRVHQLTRCIGIGIIQTAESYPVLPGECRLLICSDGLSSTVDVSEIGEVLRTSAHPTVAADMLLHMALQCGGQDNITLIVADIKKDSSFLPERSVLYMSNLLFYSGIGLIAVSAISAVIAFLVFRIANKRLNRQLEKEYGKKPN